MNLISPSFRISVSIDSVSFFRKRSLSPLKPQSWRFMCSQDSKFLVFLKRQSTRNLRRVVLGGDYGWRGQRSKLKIFGNTVTFELVKIQDFMVSVWICSAKQCWPPLNVLPNFVGRGPSWQCWLFKFSDLVEFFTQ